MYTFKLNKKYGKVLLKEFKNNKNFIVYGDKKRSVILDNKKILFMGVKKKKDYYKFEQFAI